MPEEELTYNISLNEDELSSQLERIRSQIDLTMGSLSSGGASVPEAADLIDTGSLFEGSGGAGNVVNVSQQMEQGMWSNMAATFDQTVQRTQAGFQRFTNDMQRMGVFGSPQAGMGGGNIGGFPQQSPVGFGQSVLGSVAPGLSGFDPNRGGMNYYEYKSRSSENVVDSLTDFSLNNMGAILGTAGALAGSYAAPGLGTISGGLAGLGVGSTLDLAFEVFGSRAKERMAMSEGLKNIAERAFGGMSGSEARRMAGIIQDQAYSWEGKTGGYDMESLQENVIGFSNAGGFDSVSGPQEMEKVLRGVVENTREFANNMKMAQEDAVRVMAELERNMIVSTDQMGSFSAGIGAAADR